jgi:phage shock protein A
VTLLALFFGLWAHLLAAQTANQESLSEQVQNLTDSMARTQAQLLQSQQQLDVMRQQLLTLQRQMAQAGSTGSTPESPRSMPQTSASVSEPGVPNAAAAIDDLRERQAMQQSQIATHEQSKVESESKYPVKITGLLLLNGFINTRAVDMAGTPTI